MKQVKKDHNLLEVRKEALENVVNGSIRPHGKLWGMDVFSWQNPQLDAITSTIHSLPFPIVWLASTDLLNEAYTNDETILSNIHAAISYEKGVSKEIVFPDAISSESIQKAFEVMNENRLKRGVILFCHTGIDSEYYQNAFKAYLELHQI